MVNHHDHGTPLIARLHEVRSAAELARNEGFAAKHASTQATPEHTLPQTDDVTTDRYRRTVSSDDEGKVLPFIGDVVSYVPGQSVIVERRLTLAEDLYLADHHFVHAPGIKPLSACFPVVPMTVSLEIMAEAAACVAQGYGLVGFEEVTAARWIALADTEALTLRVEGGLEHVDTIRETCRVSVVVFVNGDPQPAISAKVLFSSHYQSGLSFSLAEPAADDGYSVTAVQVYAKRQLFHGPRFQSLVGSIRVGATGVAAGLRVRSADDMFRSTSRPQLLTDPALMDAVGQTMAIWAMQQGRVAFPIGLGKLEFYRPCPAPGTQVAMRVQTTASSLKTLTADVEIEDGAGGVWMRIKGWRSWQFQWDRKLVEFRRRPTRHLLSDTLRLPTPSLDPVCQRVTKARLAGFDLMLLARHYLHMEEMAAYAARSGTPARQSQWLLGRIAAKDAVRAWSARQSGTEETLHPAAFAIESDANGQPVVSHWPEPGRPVPTVSIAHCEDEAIAMAHREPVGIDLERIAERDADFVKAIASESERALLAGFSGVERHEWVTRVWCAKEALGKLLGTGVNSAPQHFEAQAIDTHGSLQMLHRTSGREAIVTTVRDGNFMIAFGFEQACSR